MSKRLKYEDEDEQGFVMDRISGLPEPIIHHIMSRLPTKDVARIPTLSKQFNSLWRSFPIIVFDQTSFRKPSTVPTGIFCPKQADMFLCYATASIQLRRLTTDLERLRLKLRLTHKISEYSRVDSLIQFALENRVRELDLSNRLEVQLSTGYVRHPYKLMDGFSSKSITSLKLRNIQFDLNWLISGCPSLKSLALRSCLRVSEDHTINDMSTCCQSLRMLSFKDVNITEKWIENNLPSFGNLESLLIRGCQELVNIRVSNNKLQRMVVVVGSEAKSLDVIALELRSLVFVCTERAECILNIHSSSELFSKLSLTAACITDKWLKEQISKFPDIDSLKLRKCKHLNRIEICNGRLQSLELLELPELDEVIIDAPRLKYFSYKGKVTMFRMMNTPCLQNCKLSFNPISAEELVISNEWKTLRDTLSFFGICKALTLECKSEQDLIFPENVKDIMPSPLYDLKHLEIVGPWRTINASLVDKFLWIAPHLETLCIIPRSKKKVTIKMHYEKDIREDMMRNLICCRDLPLKCWRHDLERVEIQSMKSFKHQESEELLKYFGQSA